MDGVLAQLVERLVRNEKVRSSSLLGSTSRSSERLPLEKSLSVRRPLAALTECGQNPIAFSTKQNNSQDCLIVLARPYSRESRAASYANQWFRRQLAESWFGGQRLPPSPQGLTQSLDNLRVFRGKVLCFAGVTL